MHESLFCLQKEVVVLQTPPMQPFEQHCESRVQVLPEPRQAPPLVEAHTPPVHLPLQQFAFVAQARPSFLHWVAAHVPVAPQMPEQHCVFVVHVVADPVVMHGPERLPHWSGAKRPHDSPAGHRPASAPQV